MVVPALPYNERSKQFGSYGCTTRLYKADRFGNVTGEIDDGDIVSGTITHSDAAESTRRFTFELVDHRLLDPFRDYVIPEVTLARPDGTIESSTFGIFMAEMPKTELTIARRLKGTVEGKDLTYLLAKSTTPLQVFPAGRDVGSICRDLARGAGFISAQFDIPDTGYTLAAAYRVQPGETRLDTMNKLLAMANWQPIQMSSACKLKTRKNELLQYRAPRKTYDSRVDIVEILPGITSEHDTSELANKLTVRKVATEEGESTIFSTVRITNRQHPLYYNVANPGEDGTFPMELAADTIDTNDLETKAAMTEFALLELAKMASTIEKVRINTVVDLGADAYDVLNLDVWAGNYPAYVGKFWRDGWTINIDGVVGTIDSTLYRVEAIV